MRTPALTIRLPAGAAVIAAALALTACSGLARLAYNNIDWVLLERLDDFVDLRPEQRDVLEVRFESMHTAHRSKELPEIVALLRDIRAAVANGLEREQLDELHLRALNTYRRHAELLLPVVSQTLAQSDPAQVDHLAGRFEEHRNDFEKEYLEGDLQDYSAARVERTVGRLRDWLGYLTPAQKQRVEKGVGALPANGHDWLTFVRAEQLGLVAALRAGADGTEIEARLRTWWISLERLDSKVRRRLDQSRERWKVLAIELDATLEPEQRANLLERLDGYIEALSPLASA